MSNHYVNVQFSILKKLLNLAHTKFEPKIYLWLPCMCRNCHLCSKNDIFYTIMHTTVCPLKSILLQLTSMVLLSSPVECPELPPLLADSFPQSVNIINYCFKHSKIMIIAMLHNVCKMH